MLPQTIPHPFDRLRAGSIAKCAKGWGTRFCGSPAHISKSRCGAPGSGSAGTVFLVDLFWVYLFVAGGWGEVGCGYGGFGEAGHLGVRLDEYCGCGWGGRVCGGWWRVVCLFLLAEAAEGQAAHDGGGSGLFGDVACGWWRRAGGERSFGGCGQGSAVGGGAHAHDLEDGDAFEFGHLGDHVGHAFAGAGLLHHSHHLCVDGAAGDGAHFFGVAFIEIADFVVAGDFGDEVHIVGDGE